MSQPTISSPYIALAGPTASGKSAASLYLAQYLAQQQRAVEIISVDSALVYRGMDIGTAKPSKTERLQVPHHLIDIIEPSASYSAAQFVRDAHSLMADINQRGKLPLLVGGTMLYFKALFEGLSNLPSANHTLRQQFNQQAQAQGWAVLHEQLAAVDAATAARLQPNDSQRISRALEVWHLTGKPLSHWHNQDTQELAPALPMAFVSLEPNDRSWLHERIAQRMDTMLQSGFLEEVHQLRQRADVHADLPSMRCVGYRQAWVAIDKQEDVSIWREKAIAATRQLAKRQLTWLRSMPQRHVIACDQGNVPRAVCDYIQHILSKQGLL